MKLTEATKQILAARRQRRDLLAVGFEELGEGGGRIWELHRGARVGQRIRQVEIALGGKSVYVRVA